MGGESPGKSPLADGQDQGFKGEPRPHPSVVPLPTEELPCNAPSHAHAHQSQSHSLITVADRYGFLFSSLWVLLVDLLLRGGDATTPCIYAVLGNGISAGNMLLLGLFLLSSRLQGSGACQKEEERKGSPRRKMPTKSSLLFRDLIDRDALSVSRWDLTP